MRSDATLFFIISENSTLLEYSKILERSEKSSSAPKARASEPMASAMLTPPNAKSRAEAQHQGMGSSRTRSAPLFNAASARRYLSATAGVPRCTISPLIMQTTPSNESFSRSSWYLCPKWNGLYSHMTETKRNPSIKRKIPCNSLIKVV